ncbi:STRP1 protein, partial [Brachypteracias leptosomus]|nr:STRP1 protein [Brachypteracias leptosomus]
GKARDLGRPPRKDSEGYSESPDLEFEYADTDKWAAELSELYSYTEGPEFLLNRKCFEEDFRIHVREKKWTELDRNQHRTHAMRLLDGLEVTAREKRLRVARAILYVAQGTFGECGSEAEVQAWMRYNIFLLLEVGTFNALVELLNMEIDNSAACSSAVRKPAISLADSTDLRVLLNIMYLIVETVRQEAEGDKPEWKSMRQTFRAELGAPLYNNEPFSVMLFGMVTKFCSGHAPHFPMKKVLLLLWKTVLCTLGGFEELQSMKAEKREVLGLPPLPEDSIQVIRSMRAASPPASAADLIEQQQKRGRREHKALIKQDNLDAFNERDPYKADDSREEEEENDDDNSLEGETFPLERDEVMPPPIQHPPSDRITCPKGLPWAPKVREKDIEMFLESSRSKFIGYTLGSDTNTVVGLPRPIHESIRTLKQHKYTSIAEVQVHMEDEYLRSPFSGGEEEVEQVPAEILYQGLLPSLPQYMIALLKILLAAAPTSKAKTDSINILADVLPEEMPHFCRAAAAAQALQAQPHLPGEAGQGLATPHGALGGQQDSGWVPFTCSSPQFEYMAQHLVFANCIPLILKFFNQNIMSYITAKNSISVLDYPYCVVHELPELTAESLVSPAAHTGADTSQDPGGFLATWALTGSSPASSASDMLGAVGGCPLHTLRVVLCKDLQRPFWRTLCWPWGPHLLPDTPFFPSLLDLDARPWDFQAEECALRASIERFNSRRYDRAHSNPDFLPVDNCLQSVLGQRVDLPEDFQVNYDLWLEREVFSRPISWEELLQ